MGLKGTAMKHTRRAFTIVELLVVIAIIGVLMGLLVPGLGMMRRQAHATKSQANLRQWGMGTIAYANSHDERVPWEGLKDANDMAINIANANYWANAVPPFVGAKSYKEIQQAAFDAQANVPFRDEDSIFIDPSAKPENDTPWGYGQPGAGGLQRQFYFNYVPNSQLNNQLLAHSNSPQYSPDKCIRLANIKQSSNTILMLEMRANPDELSPTNVHYGRDLKRHRADWKRFAARHFRGGHMMFADGHVAWVLNDDAITNSQGSTDPSYPSGDWNTSKLIWDPLGPALDE